MTLLKLHAQEFEYTDPKTGEVTILGYLDDLENGNVKLYNTTTKSKVSMRFTYSDLMAGKCSTIKAQFGKINEETNKVFLDELRQEEEKELSALEKVSKLKEGQEFIGSDDKKYAFVKANRTRFVMKDANGKYNANFRFIKEVLSTFDANYERGITLNDLYILKQFVGKDGKTYAVTNIKRTKFDCCLVIDGHPQVRGESWTAGPGFIKELL